MLIAFENVCSVCADYGHQVCVTKSTLPGTSNRRPSFCCCRNAAVAPRALLPGRVRYVSLVVTQSDPFRRNYPRAARRAPTSTGVESVSYNIHDTGRVRPSSVPAGQVEDVLCTAGHGSVALCSRSFRGALAFSVCADSDGCRWSFKQ